MGECYLGGLGGSKIYSMADCSFDLNTSTFTFPSGVTWGNIKAMSIVSGGWFASDAAAWAMKTAANSLTLKKEGYLQAFAIADSATSFTVPQYTLGIPTNAIIVV